MYSYYKEKALFWRLYKLNVQIKKIALSISQRIEREEKVQEN